MSGRTDKSCSFYGGAAFRQVPIAACPEVDTRMNRLAEGGMYVIKVAFVFMQTELVCLLLSPLYLLRVQSGKGAQRAVVSFVLQQEGFLVWHSLPVV